MVDERMNDDEITKLQQELEEARELIEAIRSGAVDALAVNGHDGPQIFTLKSADQAYRLLVEKMNEGAMMLNREGLILYSNSSVANFLNVSLQQLIGSYFIHLVHPDHVKQFSRLFEKGWEGQSRGEFMVKSQEGVWIPFYSSMSLMEMDSEQVLGVIITNLSAKNEIRLIRSKVAEQNALIEKKDRELLKDKQIKVEAERLATVLEGLPQMAWTATPDGLINYYNQRWYDYTGTTFEETKELGWKKVLHPDLLEGNVSYWIKAIEDGEAYELEALLKRAVDDRYRWHLIRARPIKNENNDIVLWVGTCTDVHDAREAVKQLAHATEQLKRYNEDLKRKNDELIRINNDLDNFLYLASHDLKAPISNIEGLLYAFFDEIEEEKHGPMAEMMFASVERFKKTILDLTEISKAHKNEHEKPELLNFKEIVDEISLDIKELINRKKALIITDFKVPSILFHGRVVRSVIYNLVSNAIKYSNPELTPEIQISTGWQGAYLVLSVKDNGLGLTKENQLKIFKMFNRIHTHEEGSGIGLYIIKRMVENVGGKIEVESEPNQGSVFKVFLKAD